MSWKRFLICQFVFVGGWFLCALTGGLYFLIIAFVFPYAWSAGWIFERLPVTPLFWPLALGQSLLYGYVLAKASTPGRFWKRLLILFILHAAAIIAAGAIFVFIGPNLHLI